MISKQVVWTQLDTSLGWNGWGESFFKFTWVNTKWPSCVCVWKVCKILDCIVLCFILLYCAALYCTVLHCLCSGILYGPSSRHQLGPRVQENSVIRISATGLAHSACINQFLFSNTFHNKRRKARSACFLYSVTFYAPQSFTSYLSLHAYIAFCV